MSILCNFVCNVITYHVSYDLNNFVCCRTSLGDEMKDSLFSKIKLVEVKKMHHIVIMNNLEIERIVINLKEVYLYLESNYMVVLLC